MLVGEGRHDTVRRILDRLPGERGRFGPFCATLDAVCAGADPWRLDALEPQRDAPGVAEVIDYARLSRGHGDVGRAVEHGWAAWARHTEPHLRAEPAPKLGTLLWLAG